MLRKLFLNFLALNILVLAVLAIAFPNKDQHTFSTSNGTRVEEYHTRYWTLLPIWWIDFNPPEVVGCGPGVTGHSRTIQFGFIGIVDEWGRQSSER